MGTIALVCALDTKGEEARFVRDIIAARGHEVLLIDTGVVGDPRLAPDVTAADVARDGGTTLEELRRQADRGRAIEAMAAGAAAVAARLHRDGRLDGIAGLGGSAGTAVASAAMRALPVGVPKVLVSTVASGNVAPYVGTKDIALLYSVVDVAGINRLSRAVLTNAAGAIAGAVEAAAAARPPAAEKPLLAASMFGNTTRLVDAARSQLEAHGYEVLVFHATGSGGQTMEGLIRDGFVRGVLDVTTTEWADELCGGVFSAGPRRLEAAAEQGVPQVIAPGCLDMVNFGGQETIPAKYRDDPARRFYVWNPQVTLMRTTPEENAQLGRILAAKANAARGPVRIFLPLRGVSILDSVTDEGPQPFWWPEADRALFDAIKQHVRRDITVQELDVDVNDPQFARATAGALLEMLGTPASQATQATQATPAAQATQATQSGQENRG